MANLNNFHPVISSWFHKQYKYMSPAQENGWPTIAAGKHTLIFAPTGSGKTLAAFLWCINDLFCSGLKKKEKDFIQNLSGVHTLYISPLKALNNDIERNLRCPLNGISKMASKMGLQPPNIRVLVRTGDTPSPVRQSMVKMPPHILITTPESFHLLLTSHKGRNILTNVRYIIADEIHSLCGNKRGVHLSLSLERLSALSNTDPIRIGLSATQKPLDRIAAFLGGQKYFPEENTFAMRSVEIIDCGQNKRMDLKVLSAVKSFSDIPESTVWPAVIKKLYDLIMAHRTTIVFVNMRSQSEKIARQLNEMHQRKTGKEDLSLALPHHGSLSRELRFETEETLKAGRIPAVIATASLELGIDIGTIDLVVQLEAPKSVSGGMQRVGRSGHILKATSKGRILVMYPSDLDDALALTHNMKTGEIEETVIPENCLDVLAQQIVAEVAMREWDHDKLFNLFRQSYCYRTMSITVFNHVLEMLCGRFAEIKLPALKPRINWDKVNNILITRRSARLTAILNGGTIPDRGYYTVILSENNVRLGEMEEEFVFESKIGDVFFLGNNEWRIESITQDRIIVSPYKASEPRAPFWKGDIPFRSYDTSKKIGLFRENVKDRLNDKNLNKLLIGKFYSDIDTAQNLIDYFKRQTIATHSIPTHLQFIAENFQDNAGEFNLMLHAPVGGRITAPWAMSLAASIGKMSGSSVQYSYNDDGFIIRISANYDYSHIEELFNIPSHTIEKLLIDSLANSSLFAIQFRYNAARALLLPRSQPGKRIPLWVQRLRAADLLQSVTKYQDFPILVETYRSCLEDYFDIPALLMIINKIQKKEIKIQFVHTSYPSPMTTGLLFNFLSSQMYDYDRVRTQSDVALVSSELLAQVLAKERIPSVVTHDIINKLKLHWQHLTYTTKAGDPEDLINIIEELGPISEKDLQLRSKGNISTWIEQLSGADRIVNINKKDKKWVIKSHFSLYTSISTFESVKHLMRIFFRINGPVTFDEIKNHCAADKKIINDILSQWVQSGEIVQGLLIADSSQEYWCDRDNFAHLYRLAIVQRRKPTASVGRSNYYKFLLKWHDLANPQRPLISIIERYRGVKFPVLVFEREILRSRLLHLNPLQAADMIRDLAELIKGGKIIIYASKAEEKRAHISFNLRAQAHIFDDIDLDLSTTLFSSEKDRVVYAFLRENGASFLTDIAEATGLSQIEIGEILIRCTNLGMVSCDDYQTFLRAIGTGKSFKPRLTHSEISEELQHDHRRKLNRRAIREKIHRQLKIKSGRWFSTNSFAVLGKKLSYKEKVEKQARILLDRHGILVKECYRRELGFLPWYDIFQVLKRLEWQGEIRRGYFIEGLSGIQFALPQALELLERIDSNQTASFPTVMICTLDPALLFGGQVTWEIIDRHDKNLSIIRSAGNHIIFIAGKPVCYSENYAKRIYPLKPFHKEMIGDIIMQIKSWLMLPDYLRPSRRIEIEWIDQHQAAGSDLANDFLSQGFEQEGNKLVLWPSGL